jgi:hypothetical protein
MLLTLKRGGRLLSDMYGDSFRALGPRLLTATLPEVSRQSPGGLPVVSQWSPGLRYPEQAARPLPRDGLPVVSRRTPGGLPAVSRWSPGGLTAE